MTARRCLTLLLSALLLAPASAQADFAETPIYDFKGEPSCLAPTGAPGEVAIGNSNGARLLQATRAGFVPAGDVKAGEGFTCGSIVARPSGAGVIAGTQYYGDSVVAVVRDPGGAWSEPLSIAAREGWTPQTVVGAVSDRGDVVVAWLEERNRPESQIRVRLATRAPGQPFGPAKVVHTSTGMGYAQGIDAEVAATGEAVVSWTALDASAKGAPRVTTNIAIVAPDGTPGLVKQVELARSAAPSLSVASDGRALFAYTHDGYVTFIERPPGGAFGAPVKLARVTDPAGGVAIARLHDSGAAAIAWSGNYLMQVRMATRPGLGGFRPPVTVAKGDPLPKDFDPFWFSPGFAEMSGGIMFDNSLFFGEALTLTADGRALLGVTARGAETYVARLATAPLTGAAGISAGAGGEFDIPLLTQPFVLADGTPALSWITNVGENHFTLHLATEGGTRPASGPAPRVRFGAPVHRVLDYDDALRLPFTCSGPCSVRAQIVGHEYSDGVATRFSAGSEEVRIFSNEPIAVKGSSTVRVRVKYGAPDSVDLKTETLTVRVKRSSKPKPRVSAFKAVRRGGSIRVSFRLSDPPSYAPLFISGSPNRDDRGNPLVVTTATAERRVKSYRVTLRPADRVRYVTLRTIGEPGLPARTTVKVR